MKYPCAWGAKKIIKSEWWVLWGPPVPAFTRAEERLDDAIPLDLKQLNINSVSEAKAEVWCEHTAVDCVRAITSLINLLDGSGKVRVVDSLYRSTTARRAYFYKTVKKNVFSQWDRLDLSRKPKHCLYWSEADQKSDFSLQFKLIEQTFIHIGRQCLSPYTRTYAHTRTSNTQDTTREPVPTTHICVGGLTSHVRSGSFQGEDDAPDKSVTLFSLAVRPSGPNCFSEKASGRMNNCSTNTNFLKTCLWVTTPSRRRVQIISIRANDAGTNGQQRLLLHRNSMTGGLWQSTGMTWDLFYRWHQQLIRLDFLHNVKKKHSTSSVVTTCISAWEKISYNYIWMLTGGMTKDLGSSLTFTSPTEKNIQH